MTTYLASYMCIHKMLLIVSTSINYMYAFTNAVPNNIIITPTVTGFIPEFHVICKLFMLYFYPH